LPSSGQGDLLDAVNFKAAVEPIAHGDVGSALDDHRHSFVVLDLRTRRSTQQDQQSPAQILLVQKHK
jgi:hypothetical protein